MSHGSFTTLYYQLRSQFTVQPRIIIHVTAKFISQGSSVFWNKLAHLHSKKFCCLFLHDGTWREQPDEPGDWGTNHVSAPHPPGRPGRYSRPDAGSGELTVPLSDKGAGQCSILLFYFLQHLCILPMFSLFFLFHLIIFLHLQGWDNNYIPQSNIRKAKIITKNHHFPTSSQQPLFQ